MKTELSARIAVSRWTAFAELAWVERRAEIGIMCKRASEIGGRVDAQVIAQLIPSLPSAGVENIRRHLEVLGIVDSHGMLTAIGRSAAMDSMVPVPEQGVYNLWIGHHPVIGTRLLWVERQRARDEKKRGDPDPEAMDVEPDAQTVFASVTDPSDQFVFRSFPSNSLGQRSGPVGLRRSDSSQLELRWRIDTSQGVSTWELRGALDRGGKESKRPAVPNATDRKLDLPWIERHWGERVLERHGRWDVGRRCLRIKASDASADEKRSFRKSFGPFSLEVPGVASFEKVTLADVAITPSGPDESQQWAMSEFDAKSGSENRFLTREEVRAMFAGIVEGTPLEEYGATLPPHAKVLEERKGQASFLWRLAAPVDLSPFPCSAEVLREFWVGGDAQASLRSPRQDSTSDRVQVPFGTRASMAEVIAMLLAGTRPLAVLVCDRHVRGERAIKLLRVLVEAVRARSPNCRIDVWTEPESPSDAEAIAKCTGTAPKSFHEAFGKARPHDRYFLIVDENRSRRSWHMSNSLLHPSWDPVHGDTINSNIQLRWKDLLAVSQDEGSLMADLARWFGSVR